MTERIFVAGGFAEVTPERCTVLADEASRCRTSTVAAVEAELKALRDELTTARDDAERIALAARIDVADAQPRSSSSVVYRGGGRLLRKRQGRGCGLDACKPAAVKPVGSLAEPVPEPTETHEAWTLDDIAWDRFDPAKVDPEVVRIVKAASMVEQNGDDYATISATSSPTTRRSSAPRDAGRRRRCSTARRWPLGRARRSGMGLPGRLRAVYAPATRSTQRDASMRGSRTGELIARCMVETGTSSYYTALGRGRRRSRCCSRSAADRGGRVAALQALLQAHEALPGARESRPLGRAARRGWAASASPRMTSSPSPITPPTTRAARPTTAAPTAAPMRGAPTPSIVRAMSSAASP